MTNHRPAGVEPKGSAPASRASQLLAGIYNATWPESRPLLALICGIVLAAGGFAAFSTPHRFHRWAVFLTGFLLYPAALRISDAVAGKWRPLYTILCTVLLFAGFAYFITNAGNHQFAGFDLSLMVDIGWRLIHGQIPYRDFICTLPPGFMLGVKYAYQAFGVQWDALLYLDVLFACFTFVWIYGLLSVLLRSRLAAFLIAIGIQCAGVLPISYWWHNSIASMSAAIFFLSCLAFLRFPHRVATQVSYVAALTLIGMMKPNTALPMAAGSVVLVFLATKAKGRLAMLTATAAGCLVLILVANQISPLGLIQSYRAAAVARGVSTFGFNFLQPADRMRAGIFITMLLAPGLWRWWRLFREAVRTMDIAGLSHAALLVLAPMIGIFAMFTNGELKDTDFPLLICFGAVMMWGAAYESTTGWGWATVLRVYASFLFGLAVSDLYLGMSRARIEFAEHAFFEWSDTEHNPGVPYFRHLRASKGLQNVVTQAAEVVRESRGRVFFGPQIEFGYAAFGVPSPRNLPVWWHAGTSYAKADEAAIAEIWRRAGFSTLIFLRGEDNITPDSIQRIIHESYVEDTRWPDLMVYHAKSPQRVM